jgi:hypothetical protein
MERAPVIEPAGGSREDVGEGGVVAAGVPKRILKAVNRVVRLASITPGGSIFASLTPSKNENNGGRLTKRRGKKREE